jgi:hypothetical protein
MIRLSAEPGHSPAEAAAKLRAAAKAAGVDGQVAAFTEAISQLHRFVANNIEVDTGRTKNSIFPRVSKEANGVEAMLGTAVIYSPYVRDAGHSQQFFDYAEEREVPQIMRWLADEMIIKVEQPFS